MNVNLPVDLDDLQLKAIENRHYLLDLRQASISSINQTSYVMISMLMAGFSAKELVNILEQQTGEPSARIEAELRYLATLLNNRQWAQAIPATEPFAAPMPVLPTLKRCYRIGDKTVEVFFSNAPLMDENHSLLEPMQTDTGSIDHQVCIYEEEDSVALYIDGEPWLKTRALSWINGLLRHCLIQLSYQREGLLTLHAAAFAKGDKAILIIAPSGTGKSTLATHMSLNGFDYLGDDSIPIDMDKNIALPLPTAISLKEGSWALFPDITSTLNTQNTYKISEKTFKTWPPNNTTTQAKTIAAIVFYERDVDAEQGLFDLDVETALVELQKAETRFNPDHISITLTKLVDWVHSNSIKRLNCASLNEARRLIEPLLI